MLSKSIKIGAHVFSLWLLLLCSFAYAADDDSDDPPDRVARLSYKQGAISMQPAGTDDWADASINRPLTTGDKLWVDRSSRAELQAGATNIHVDQGTGFSFLELSDDVLQMRVTDGAINVNVQRMRDGEVIEIDTPTTAVTITEPGEYHVEVTDEGANTIVKTYSGECEVADNNQRITRVRSRQQVSVDDDRDGIVARETFEPRDDFDAWANDRNRRYQRSASARYVSPDVIGYADLDDQGDWISERDYGYVWYPTRVAADWSPYRFGHWTWVAPWGWTWVDDAAWGFAPFHYGRWAYVRNRWGWVPGPVRVRAVYAPALVAWVGSPGVSISVSIGSGIGWFPLAPREVYVPGYHCSERHLQNVNYANTVIVNRTIINNVYVNRATHIDYAYGRNPRAVTVVQRDTFVGARPVHNHMVAVNDRELRGWRTQNATPAIAPDRASTLGPRWNANTSRNEHWREREVIARHTPPGRASFVQEQQVIRANSGRPPSRNELWRGDREHRDVRMLGIPRDRANANIAAPATPTMPNVRDEQRRRMNDRPPQVESRDVYRGAPNRDSENNRRDRGLRNRANESAAPAQATPQVAPPVDANTQNRERMRDEARDDGRRFDRGPQYRVDPRPRTRLEPGPEAAAESQRQELQRQEAQRAEGQRLEAQRMENQRLESQRVENQRQENLRRENALRENRDQERWRQRRPQTVDESQNRAAPPAVMRQERPAIERPPMERRAIEPRVERPAPPQAQAPEPQAQPQPRMERPQRDEPRGNEDRGQRGRHGEQ